MKKFVFFGVCLVAMATMIGCSVSKARLDNAESRIEALRAKGVPDSSLSRAVVFLYQARDAKQRGNAGLAKMSGDSMGILIAQAEAQYSDDMKRLRPFLESSKAAIAKEKTALSGLQLKEVDSLVAVIDSFARINWLLQAEAVTRDLLGRMNRLKFDEGRVKELRPRLTGTWVCTQRTKNKVVPEVNAIETKTFTFGSNGKTNLTEKKKGQSTAFFKEDWEFVSSGEYDLKGDTICLFINRFKAVRQHFWDLKEKDGRQQWVRTVHPSYDSTITDGSQDRYITFQDLKEDFSKR